MTVKKYDPYMQWNRMDNYLKSVLFESEDLDEEMRRRIKHFNYQYLIKLASIGLKEAVPWERDISPWRPMARGDYHRSYHHANLMLRAIESELSKYLGVDSEKIILLSDQELIEECAPYYREFRGQKMLVIPDRERREELIQRVKERGFSPSLQNAAAITADLGLVHPNPTFEFPKTIQGASRFCEFLNHPVFISFKQFAKDSFTALIVVDLLEGFSRIDLDGEKGERLIRDSYGRVLYLLDRAMKQRVSKYRDLQKLENYLELIYEEMTLWLMLKEPYSQGALENIITSMIQPPAFFRMTQSGMAAFSEVIKVLLGKETFILYFDDCSFENVASIRGPNSRVVQFPDYEASLKEQLRGLNGKKIDLLFVDFHTNFMFQKFSCERHDVKQIVSQVLPFASSSFTVIIDNTIGYIASDEIKDLLLAFPKLNVIVHSSHQKFDLFGTDKFTAGSYCVYSNDPRLIDKFKQIRGGEIDWVSRQGFSHFFTFGAQKLEERRTRIFANARYVNGKMSPHVHSLVKKVDPITYSVDLQWPLDLDGELALLKEFKKRGIPILTRSSFGYNITSISFLRKQWLRFSIGLEERKFLDQFVDACNEIFISLS